MKYLCCILLGYLAGSLNPSYLLARAHGFDIREQGSGNAGASNTLILLGKLRGVLCALFDIGKALLVIKLTVHLFPQLDHAFAVTAVSCILGHIYPFYMKFRGGKGLACLGGTILAYNPRVFLAMLILELVVALITNYICFVPITASVIFPLVYIHFSHDLLGAGLFGIAAAVIIYRHKENLIRIRQGKEMRLSYLWDREKESERLKKNYDRKN